MWLVDAEPFYYEADQTVVIGVGTFISLQECLVAHGGFEPPISALRGRCPGPLDECATPKMLDRQARYKIQRLNFIRAGRSCKLKNRPDRPSRAVGLPTNRNVGQRAGEKVGFGLF